MTADPVRIEIDLNVRTHRNRTFTRLSNVHGPIAEGQAVEVYQSGICGPGRVVEIDRVKRLVYLWVDWAALREEDA